MIRKLISILKHKIFIIGILILVQLLFLVTTIFVLSEYFVIINSLLLGLSLIVSIYIFNAKDNPSYKLTWIILIMSVPILGGFLYLLFGGQKVPKELRIRDSKAGAEFKEVIHQEEEVLKEFKQVDKSTYKQANYLWKSAGFPLYRNGSSTFYPSGEEKFKALCDDLRKAQNYIFLEYFIIEPGVMWDSILAILIEKVKAGVEVRLLYDDVGCFTTLPNHYDKILKQYGIKVKVFNKIEPKLAIQMNHRDHRKIAIIDGVIGYMGGINLADEYINAIEKYGHWKDYAVRLSGSAVWCMTLMFLQFWNYDEKQKEDILKFQVEYKEQASNGYVQPFSDAPTDEENIGEYTHMNLIHSATTYLYATTPYLIIDHEMKLALMLAAKSGVDVKILVPHIPDKKPVFMVTQANYAYLLEAGVKIYEYTPGFIHGKMMVSDDSKAMVGSVNMDYRSYYLHYECGVCLYNVKEILDMKKEFEEALSQSQEITLEMMRQIPLWKRFVMAFLNLFSPLI